MKFNLQLEQDRIDSLVAEAEEWELTQVKAWLRDKGTTQWVNWCIDSDDELSQAATWFILQCRQYEAFLRSSGAVKSADEAIEDLERFRVLNEIYRDWQCAPVELSVHSWDGPDMFTYQPGLRPPNGLEA